MPVDHVVGLTWFAAVSLSADAVKSNSILFSGFGYYSPPLS